MNRVRFVHGIMMTDKNGKYTQEYLALRRKLYAKAKKKRKFTVYYLPEEHYVGVTQSNPEQRMSKHRNAHNRITTGWEIVGVYDTGAMALLIEAYLHTLGYYGCAFGDRNSN